MTSRVTSQVASQPEPESTSGCAATAEVAALDGGGGMSDVQTRASTVEHQDTPAAAVVMAAAAVEPAQDNDSLEVQVDVNSVQTSPMGTLQQQCVAETCLQ